MKRFSVIFSAIVLYVAIFCAPVWARGGGHGGGRLGGGHHGGGLGGGFHSGGRLRGGHFGGNFQHRGIGAGHTGRGYHDRRWGGGHSGGRFPGGWRDGRHFKGHYGGWGWRYPYYYGGIGLGLYGLGYWPGFYGVWPGYYGGYYPYGWYGGYYGYPNTVGTAPASPPVYIQKPSPGFQQFKSGFWYYCTNPEGYYPYVKECLNAWQQVAPRPSAPR